MRLARALFRRLGWRARLLALRAVVALLERVTPR